MRKILAAMILVAAVALNASVAFACRNNAEIRSSYFGDGFDNTTCADLSLQHECK